MSIAILASRAQLGIEAPPVTIEVFLSGGLPRFNVVGMPETAVRESSDRVRGAIINSGLPFPRERITVQPRARRHAQDGRTLRSCHRARHSLRREGGPRGFARGHRVSRRAVAERRPAAGTRRAACGAAGARGRQCRDGATGKRGRSRAGALHGSTRRRRCWTSSRTCAEPLPFEAAPDISPGAAEADGPDLDDVRGQSRAKRALEIAAAGGHNLLLIGPPGTGKSMLARRLPGILPPMTEREALETAGVDSVLGNRVELSRWRLRPFRAPHHTASAPALVGGGPGPRPARSRAPTTACCFSTSCPSSAATCWRCCANRWKPASSRYPGPRTRPISRRGCSSSPR